jgi:hypothetical protein
MGIRLDGAGGTAGGGWAWGDDAGVSQLLAVPTIAGGILGGRGRWLVRRGVLPHLVAESLGVDGAFERDGEDLAGVVRVPGKIV